MLHEQHPRFVVRTVLNYGEPYRRSEASPVLIANEFAILDRLPKITLRAYWRMAKNIHSGIDGALIATWKTQVGRIDNSRRSSRSSDGHLVFEFFPTTEISFREIGEDAVLYVIKIEDNDDPINRILAT